MEMKKTQIKVDSTAATLTAIVVEGIDFAFQQSGEPKIRLDAS